MVCAERARVSVGEGPTVTPLRTSVTTAYSTAISGCLIQCRAMPDPGVRVRNVVVGVVGAAVPTELVLAAGLHPVRISGRPRPAPLVDAYGFNELDPPTTAVMEQLLAPDHGFDFVLIGGDTLAQTVLFKTLRELQRVEPVASIPPFAFLDLLHLPYRTTARYNRRPLIRICDVSPPGLAPNRPARESRWRSNASTRRGACFRRSRGSGVRDPPA